MQVDRGCDPRSQSGTRRGRRRPSFFPLLPSGPISTPNAYTYGPQRPFTPTAHCKRPQPQATFHAYGDSYILPPTATATFTPTADSDLLRPTSYSYVLLRQATGDVLPPTRNSHIHTDGNSHPQTATATATANRYGYGYSDKPHTYSDANTKPPLPAPKALKRQPTRTASSLTAQLDQCQRLRAVTGLDVSTSSTFWHLRTGIPRSACRRKPVKKRHWSGRETRFYYYPCPGLQTAIQVPIPNVHQGQRPNPH